MKKTTKWGRLILFLMLGVFIYSCQDDANEIVEDEPNEIVEDETNENEDDETEEVDDSQKTLTYIEQNGVVSIEAENLILNENWLVGEDSNSGASGGKFIYWDGADYFGDPTHGVIPITLEINTPGTYLFSWNVKVGKGTESTEHNDSWIKIEGDDFYAKEDDNIGYPAPGCYSNPNQSCVHGGYNTGGFFKVFGGGLNSFKENAHTNDGSFYKIYAVFDNPGTYTLTLAARSSYHYIDKMTLTKQEDETNENEDDETEEVDDGEKTLTYTEQNGVVSIEAENLILNENWLVGEDSNSGASGGKYIYWDGANYFGDPTHGVIPITLKINTPGTYLFGWNVKVGRGANPTEHNDSWIKIEGDDFYAQENDKIAYPPPGCYSNANQSCVNGGYNTGGFFKVFGGGLNAFLPNAHTYDESYYKIYAVFNSAGTYTLTLAARSNYHYIDKMTLTKQN